MDTLAKFGELRDNDVITPVVFRLNDYGYSSACTLYRTARNCDRLDTGGDRLQLRRADGICRMERHNRKRMTFQVLSKTLNCSFIFCITLSERR